LQTSNLLYDFSIVNILQSKDSEERTLYGVQVQISVIYFIKILLLYIQFTHILEQTYLSGNIQQYSIPAHLSQQQQQKKITEIQEELRLKLEYYVIFTPVSTCILFRTYQKHFSCNIPTIAAATVTHLSYLSGDKELSFNIKIYFPVYDAKLRLLCIKYETQRMGEAT